MRNVLAALALLAGFGAASAEPVVVTVKPVSSFSLIPLVKTFGGLEWRGGVELMSADDNFGGLSSLAMSADGKRLLAVSDAGRWFTAAVTYSAGDLAGLAEAELAPMLDDKGKEIRAKWRNDAEALGLWEQGRLDGQVLVGFENRTRAGIFDVGRSGFAAAFQKLKIPKEIVAGPGNRELESIGRFPSGPHKGRIVAISEANRDSGGNIRGWVFGDGAPFAFAIRPHLDFLITDAAFLPGGDLVTVERSYGASRIPGVAIRRFSSGEIKEGAVLAPRLVMEASAPIHAVDNMEGIAVHQQDGETRITLISDNNFDTRFQRTLLLQFALKD